MNDPLCSHLLYSRFIAPHVLEIVGRKNLTIFKGLKTFVKLAHDFKIFVQEATIHIEIARQN